MFLLENKLWYFVYFVSCDTRWLQTVHPLQTDQHVGRHSSESNANATLLTV